MQVATKTLTGKVNQYEFPSSSLPSLLDLKNLIYEIEGIPADDQNYILLSEVEVDELPYGEGKMIEFCHRAQTRFLVGDNQSLQDLGVPSGATLLLVLAAEKNKAQEANVATASSGKKIDVDVIDSLVMFEGRALGVTEVEELLVILLQEQRNEKVVSIISRILAHSYRFSRSVMEVSQTMEVVATILENTSNHKIALLLLSICFSAARSEIDGIVPLMISLGILRYAKREFEVITESKFTYSDSQRQIMVGLDTMREHHEECAADIAAVIYKDNFHKNSTLAVLGFQPKVSEKSWLWEEPFKFYLADQENKADYIVSFLEVSGLDLASKDSNGLSDPYFKIGLTPDDDEPFKSIFKSSTKKKTLTPVWNMTKEKKVQFVVPFKQTLTIQIYDEDLIKDEFMGSVTFNPATLYAIQEAGNVERSPSFILSMKVDAYERKKKDLKHHHVLGYLVMTMTISHE